MRIRIGLCFCAVTLGLVGCGGNSVNSENFKDQNVTMAPTAAQSAEEYELKNKMMKPVTRK